MQLARPALTGLASPDFLPFLFYECSNTDCSNCLSDARADCVWCLSNNTCATADECSAWSGVATRDTCPTVLSVTPPSAAVDGGTVVSIAGGEFVPGLQLTCAFGNASVPATFVSPTLLTCVAPAASQAAPDQASRRGRRSLSALGGSFSVPFALLNGDEVYTAAPGSAGSFEFYSCEGADPCDDCQVASRADCGWCLATGECSTAGACSVQASWLEASCPSLLRVSPSSISPQGGTELAVTGTGFGGDFICAFTFADQAGEPTGDAVQFAAEVVSETSLTCEAPAADGDTALLTLVVASTGAPFAPGTPSLELTYDDALVVGGSANGNVVPVVMACVAVCAILAAVLITLLVMRQRRLQREEELRKRYAPPPLDNETLVRLLYGEIEPASSAESRFAEELNFFIQVFFRVGVWVCVCVCVCVGVCVWVVCGCRRPLWW